MPEAHLLLGPVLLGDFEVASGVSFGGAQALAVHDLPGGTRVIDATGRRDGPISFSGYFSGDNATVRARTLDSLRGQGVALPLIWDEFFYTVLIRDFVADYQCGWWIPYRCVCAVLRDEAAAVVDAVAGLAGSLAGDLGAAIGFAAPCGVDLTAAATAAGTAGAAVAGTAAYGAAVGALGAGQSSVQSARAQAEATLPQTTLFAPGAGPISAAATVGAASAAVASAGTLARLGTAAVYLGRAARNLATATP